MNNVERDIVLKLFDWNIIVSKTKFSVAPQTPHHLTTKTTRNQIQNSGDMNINNHFNMNIACNVK